MGVELALLVQSAVNASWYSGGGGSRELMLYLVQSIIFVILKVYYEFRRADSFLRLWTGGLKVG